MRPHRLRVTAFGAFGGTVEVCFDDLASAGLFLLHGETGAGKTTLLDAIGFALYGRVPGERGKARRLRSDHAAPGTTTEVQLEATMGGRRMRITRKPEQQRPKRRGGGTTTEQAKVLLEEATDNGWRAVSTRAGEADDEIKDLMGMSAEQFYQVVLLPQGQFAQFLHAAADKRAELLEKLFATDRFGKVEDWLAERRRFTAREVDKAEQAVRELAARVAQVAGSDPAASARRSRRVPRRSRRVPRRSRRVPRRSSPCCPIPPCPAPIPPRCPTPPGPRGWPGSPPPRPRPARSGSAPSARSLIRPSTGSGTPSGWPSGSAGAPRPSAPATRWPRPSPPSTHYTESSPPPLRAAEAAGALDEAERAGDALAETRAEQDQARAQVEVLAGADPTATAAELRAAGQEYVARLGRLDALRALDQQAADEDDNADAARTAADTLAARLAEAEAMLTARQQQRPGLLAEREQARQAGQELPAHAAAADACRRAADDAGALVKARADARRQEDAYFQARLRTSALRDSASRLREARIDGMRAELAATLVDGAPCPVCGSLDHPELCELRGERVTREQEETADAEAAAAADRAEMIGARLAAADILVADLTARLEGAGFTAPADLVTLEAEAGRLAVRADALAAKSAQLTAAAARLSKVETALDALDQDIAGTGRLLAELTEQRDAELRQAAEADQRAARHRESLTAQLDGLPDLDTARRAAREAAHALIAAADAADGYARAEQAARSARDRAMAAATAAGFADLDAARAAQRPAGWRDHGRSGYQGPRGFGQGQRRAPGRSRPRRTGRPARRRRRSPGRGGGGPQGLRGRAGRARPHPAPGRAAGRSRPPARRPP